MDECHSATKLSKHITLKDAISWLTLASTACFSGAHPALSEKQECSNEDDLPLAQVIGDIQWKGYLTMDDNTTTIVTCLKLQAQITDYRLLMVGQTTQQSIQDFCMS